MYKAPLSIVLNLIYFFLFSFNAQCADFVCEAVKTLQTLSQNYKLKDQPVWFDYSSKNLKYTAKYKNFRKTITTFIRTGNYDKYRGINYEQVATEAEKEIIYTAIINSVTHPHTNEDVFTEYEEGLKFLFENKSKDDFEQAYFHQFTAYTVACLAYDEKVKKRWGNFSYGSDEDEEDEMWTDDDTSDEENGQINSEKLSNSLISSSKAPVITIRKEIGVIDDSFADKRYIPDLENFKDSIRNSEAFQKAMFNCLGEKRPVFKPYFQLYEEIDASKQKALQQAYRQENQVDRLLEARGEGKKIYLFVGRGNKQNIPDDAKSILAKSEWIYLDADASTIDFAKNNFLWGDVYKVLKDANLKNLFSGIVFDLDVLHWMHNKEELMEICHQVLSKDRDNFLIMEKHIQYVLDTPEYSERKYTFDNLKFPTSVNLKTQKNSNFNETYSSAKKEAYLNIEAYLRDFYAYVSSAEQMTYQLEYSVATNSTLVTNEAAKLLSLINFTRPARFFIAVGPYES